MAGRGLPPVELAEPLRASGSSTSVRVRSTAAAGTFTVEGHEDFRYDVTIRYRWVEGRFNADEVSVRGQEDFWVTGGVMRRIPCERLFRDHLTSLIATALRATSDADDDAATVAAVYRLAYVSHEPPVQAVARHFGIPTSTAAKRVMRARERGSLSPTSPGKAAA